MTSPSLIARFAGQEFVLDARGALYWPNERTLIVSDLHLEKSTYLAAHGSLIAPYDTLDTLERLQQLIRDYTPHQLLLLGDSFHDRHAWERLDHALRARLEALVASVAVCRWIEGNHDVALKNHPLQGFSVAETIQGILFTHEHDVASVLPQIIGHYHPKTSISVRGRRVRGACFAHTEDLFIMPAFGSYTGGLDMQHAAYKPLAKGQDFKLYLIYGTSIHRLANV